VVRQVAREADVSATLIIAGAGIFAPRRADLPRCRGEGRAQPIEEVATAIEVELSGWARLRIPATVPPELAAAVVRALARR